ncbi:DUF3368 domain-containing protein [Nostoc sp.]|uniref:DUF3368 domain-containing protein n=1 Tax=Nostoc sp. TaxID=1180 RepID=UPI002FF5B02B
MIVVSDTSPIINLAAIGQLDLLQQLYGSIVIPLAVYNEMVTAGKVVPGAVEVQTLSWIQTQTVADTQKVTEIQTNQDNIDLGEAEAIILALEVKALSAVNLNYDNQLFLHLLWLLWACGVFGLLAAWSYQRDRTV